MHTIQPQWQSDDGDVVPVRIAGAQEAAIPVSSISRRPAAIVGIVIALTLGMFVFNLRGSFTAQVGGDAVVSITANGFVPENTTVAPGGTIRWRNDDAIPHILASGTLNTEETSPLESLPIFPGEEYVATVVSDAQPGTYDYISRTSDFNGTITVQTADEPTPVEPMPTSSERPAPSIRSSAASSRAAMTTTTTTPPSTGVPVNPYTIDKAGLRPTSGTAMGGPILPQTPPPAMTQTKTKPTAQPASGSGANALIIVAALGVWVMWRKTLSA